VTVDKTVAPKGFYIGTESSGAGADPSSKVGTWSGSLVLELLAVVPFLAATPALFHETSAQYAAALPRIWRC
jgi:hypothetical protein